GTTRVGARGRSGAAATAGDRHGADARVRAVMRASAQACLARGCRHATWVPARAESGVRPIGTPAACGRDSHLGRRRRRRMRMCRWMAWSGQPVLIDELLFKPPHGLIDQSLHSRMGAETTNGDGFGMGWY